MSQDADQLAKACADSMWANDQASSGLGMQIDKVEQGFAQNPPRRHQWAKRLVIAGRAKFEPPRGDLAVSYVPPNVEPRIIIGWPDVPNQQTFGRIARGHPAVPFRFVEDERADIVPRRSGYLIPKPAKIDSSFINNCMRPD